MLNRNLLYRFSKAVGRDWRRHLSIGKFDYIVVGAGTAGCVLANRLSKDPTNNVLLVEAGRKDDYLWIHIPVGYLYCINNPMTDWMYKTESEKGLNGRSLIYPRGKVLGGCSSINGMIYMRGQSRDYNEWASLTGDNSWRWESILPLFVKSEDSHIHPESKYHGVGGEWRVEKQRLSWEILDSFRDAAAQVGIPNTDDFNRGDNEGCAYFEVNQKTGVRCSTAGAFLKPALQRKNLTVLTNCQVKRLLMKPDASEISTETPSNNKHCIGVELEQNGKVLQIHATRETILAAGSIGTPHLLQLSGIGRPEDLQSVNIPVKHVLPGVGYNLQDHLQIRSVYKIQGAKTLNKMANSIFGKIRIGLQYALSQSGPMSMAPSQLGLFTRSDTSQTTPNLQYHVQPLSLDKFGDPLHDFPAFTASVCNLRPTSRGSIVIQSPDYKIPPKIAPNYLTTAEDRRIAAQSLLLTRKIVSAPAMSKYIPMEYKPGEQYQSDEELAHMAGDIGTTIFHPVGTCKMGKENDPNAVVNSKLCVRGIAGLRIADASVMPTITSGNTNSPTIMIAEKAAELILNAKI